MNGARAATTLALLLALTGCGGPSVGDAGPLATLPAVADGSTPLPTSAGPTPLASLSPTRSPSRTSNPSPPPGATATATAPGRTPTPGPGGARVHLKAYFFLDDGSGSGPTLVPVEREVPATLGVAGAAIRELLAGPRPKEWALGVRSYVPSGTVLLGIDVDGSVATIDLSREFESGGGTARLARRIAQVVYTLTQFPTIDAVRFRLDGEPVPAVSAAGDRLDRPVGRDAYVAFLPPIFVDGPAWAGFLGRPARITGKSNVFEATFFVALEDENGRRIARTRAMATCGTGCWGDFDVRLHYSVSRLQFGYLVVWSASAMDGSIENERRYPVWLAPAR